MFGCKFGKISFQITDTEDCQGGVRGDRAVPGDRKERASKVRAERWLAPFLFFCALTFAGMYSEITCFFRLRGWRARGLRGRPLANHRRPRPFLPWESTLNVRTAEILHLCSISSGPTADGTSSISPFARWINRDFTMLSGSVSFIARSTPRMQQFVLLLSTPSRQGVHSEPSGLDRTHTRCTFAGESLMRKAVSLALSVFCATLAS